MFSKSKVNKEVKKILDLAEKTAQPSGILPLPVYLEELHFELLFFYLFVLDYRIFSKEYNSKLRGKIIDEFLNKISPIVNGEKKFASDLYNQRINEYFKIINKSNTKGEFLEQSTEYIEVMTLYNEKMNKISVDNVNQIETIKEEFEIQTYFSKDLAKLIMINLNKYNIFL